MKTVVYKLTDSKGQTHNSTQWGDGVTHEASGMGELCGSGFLHCYSDPLLAAFLNPIHSNFSYPILWEAEGGGVMKDDCGLKMGFSKLTTVKKLEIQRITTDQRIAFGILCTLEVCKNKEVEDWANKWLSGEDRSRDAAWSVAPASRVAWAAGACEGDWANRGAADAVAEAAFTKPLDLPAIAKKAMEY